jgi:hypothetical protein
LLRLGSCFLFVVLVATEQRSNTAFRILKKKCYQKMKEVYLYKSARRKAANKSKIAQSTALEIICHQCQVDETNICKMQ